MAYNSFKVNHSINLTPQTSTQLNPDTGDLVFDTTRGFQYFRSSYWSDLESVSALTAILSMTSAQFTSSIVQSSIVRLNGAGIASTISGLAASFHGKRVYIFNNTDQTIIIANDSGTEPTVANRILAPNASDLNVPPTAAVQLYYDTSSSRWIVISQPASGGSGLKNYLPKGNAESGLTGQNYNDGAVVQPIDGAGGVFDGNFVVSNVSPLADKNSFIYTPGTTLGQGHSFDFTIDREDLGQNLMVRMSYEITGTFVTGDLSWFVYDIVNNNIIQPYNNQIVTASGAQKTICIFKTRTNSTQYRLCLHQTTANTAYTMKFEVAVNPQDLAFVPNIQSPQAAGFIQEYGGTTDPRGFFICDGRAVSRATYADLFAIIGTAFGAGNGTTTFNIPDMRGRFARGVDGTAGRDIDSAGRTAMNVGGNTGNNIGSVQTDAVGPHTHDNGVRGLSGWNIQVTPNTSGSGLTVAEKTGAAVNWQTGLTGSAATGSDTRPLNAYVNFIIKIYNDQYVPVSTTALPYQQEVGFIQASGSNTIGQDFLYCDGSSYQTSSYPELFAKIGYNFGGAGTSFNVPDLRGKFLRGIDDTPSVAGSGTAVSNVLTYTGHKFRPGQRVRFATIGALAGVNTTTTYYVCVVSFSANTVTLSTSHANAMSGSNIAVTGTNSSTLMSWEDPDASTREKSADGSNTGKNIGSWQIEAIADHAHNIPSGFGTDGDGNFLARSELSNNRTATSAGIIGNGIVTTPSVSSETRPMNIAIKYYIRANPSVIPAYEQQVNQGVDLVMTTNDANWNVADTFYKDSAVDVALTFSNVSNGKTIIVTIRNSGASNINVTLPAGTIVPSGIPLVVQPAMYNVYTFFRSNSKTFATVITDMA